MQDMRKGRLSRGKQAKLVEHFIVGATARLAAIVAGVNEKTAIYYFQRLRELIALHTAGESQQAFDGEIELDENYLGGHRKGKRGREAGGKVSVFGLLQRGGRVYAKIIPNSASAALMPIIEKKVAPDSMSIRTAGRATTCWMCPGSSTAGSIILCHSPTGRTTSTGLRIFRAGQSAICADTMAFQETVFRCI